MKKVKLIFFDMEGTLFEKAVKTSGGNVAPSAWRLIAEHLGEEAVRKDDETQEKWNTGKYNGYVEWCKDAIRMHKKHGLKKQFFDKVIESIKYHKGVKETFKELNKKGYITALISGGFKAQADRAQKELKIDHAFTACEYFWDEKGKILHWNLLPCDYEGKADFMKLIMKEHKLSPEECAFVGDGVNDIFLAKEVGLSIAFNGAKELQRVSTYSINQKEGEEDFRDVLKHF